MIARTEVYTPVFVPPEIKEVTIERLPEPKLIVPRIATIDQVGEVTILFNSTMNTDLEALVTKE